MSKSMQCFSTFAMIDCTLPNEIDAHGMTHSSRCYTWRRGNVKIVHYKHTLTKVFAKVKWFDESLEI